MVVGHLEGCHDSFKSHNALRKANIKSIPTSIFKCSSN